MKKEQTKKEKGRSMIEMLGVLVLIGVLSIGAIMVYRYAMDKYRANDTINDIKMAALIISDQRRHNQLDLSLDEMGSQTKTRYPLSAAIHPKYDDYFEIRVDQVPARVCKQMLSMNWTMPISIFVGLTKYDSSLRNTSICGDDGYADRLFYEFKNDLTAGSDIAADDKHENWRCNHDNDCLCGTCQDHFCETLCPPNATCTKSYDDPRWMMCCLPENVIGGYCCHNVVDGRCCNQDGICCPADKPMISEWGSCLSCEYAASVRVSDPYDCENRCPNRHLNNEHHRLCTLCGTAGTAYADKPLIEWTGACYSCDEPAAVSLGAESLAVATSKCAEVCPNREKNGNYCYLKTCPADHPLKDAYKGCHACLEKAGVYIGAQKENCDVCGDLREISGDYCILKEKCPEIKDESGSCRPCNDTTNFVVKTPSDCESLCPNRHLNNAHHRRCTLCGTPGTAYASKPLIEWTGACYSCDEPTAVSLGAESLAVATSKCAEVCPNREKNGNYCYLKTCPADYPLKDSSGGCHACQETALINVSGVQERCAVCQEDREVVGNYCVLKQECPAEKPLKDRYGTCYACDNNGNVDVTGALERCLDVCPDNRLLSGNSCVYSCEKGYFKPNSGSCVSCDSFAEVSASQSFCEKCPNREYKDGKCVLKQSCEDQLLIDKNGTCYPCNITTSVDVGGDGNKCALCQNRHMEGHLCVLNI